MPKPSLLAAAGLVHQRRGPLPAGAGQQVVAQFVEHAVVHIPNSLLVAAVPHFGDPAVDDTEDLHAADRGLGAVLERHRRLVDDRDVLAVVARNHEVQVEVGCSSTPPTWSTIALDRLLVGQRRAPPPPRGGSPCRPSARRRASKSRSFQTTRLYSSTTSRAVPGHANTSSASISSMVATARSVSVTHSCRDRSGIASQPLQRDHRKHHQVDATRIGSAATLRRTSSP